jgi:hypothetical protein
VCVSWYVFVPNAVAAAVLSVYETLIFHSTARAVKFNASLSLWQPNKKALRTKAAFSLRSFPFLGCMHRRTRYLYVCMRFEPKGTHLCAQKKDRQTKGERIRFEFKGE